ncbi:ABC transporter substrate-binding protein [Rhodococcus sp. X156]|uniref:ABC transporter substrate-binding protein n=1 Tax=Rhodococcus sp. X156 TaxID=2499145 RepID=UPI000FD804A5|nr:ABC transporter substrate-binding protein [Rhodococcus sp. X156]
MTLFRTRALVAAALLAVVGLTAACGSSGEAASAPSADPTAKAAELRLGFFANVTHAPALVGLSEGFLTKNLGATKLSTQVFNAGPAAIEALRSGSIDATYIGPSPSVNGFLQTKGEALRIVSGAASGGAQLVVREGINNVADLKGKTLATPQLGNTQDVALRAWLDENGLKTSVSSGGDVTITPTENATTLQLFRDGKIDGAWLPEPWSSRLVLEAGAKVLVDEKTLWPEGKFVTTQLIVRTDFLNSYPGTVRDLLAANLESVEFISANSEAAKKDTNNQIDELTGKPLTQPTIDRAWPNLDFTYDPLAASLQKSADDAVTAGTTKQGELTGIYDLRLLNALLAEQGKPALGDAGLGQG